MPVRENGKPSSTESTDKSSGKDDVLHTALKPFLFHGMIFNDVKSWDTQAKADCFLCGKEGKFCVGLKDVDKKHFAGGGSVSPALSPGTSTPLSKSSTGYRTVQRAASSYRSWRKNAGYSIRRPLSVGGWLSPS